MKRVLSLVLALVMVLGMIPTFAAEMTGGEHLLKHGFITGKPGDDVATKLDAGAALTRQELAALIAELMGEKEIAAVFAQPADYADADKIGAWAVPFVAYAQVNGWMSGKPGNMFDPTGPVPGQQLAAVLMNALGYTVDTQAKYATVIADAAVLGLVVPSGNLTRGEAFTAMWTAVSEVKVNGEDVTLGVKLGKLDPPAPVVTELMIDSVVANNLKEIVIKFNQAVDKDTVVAANFSLSPAAGTLTPVLGADGMTVTVTTQNTLTNQGAYTLTVEKVESATEQVLAKVAKAFTAFDATLPTVERLVITGPKTFDLYFNEPIALTNPVSGSVEVKSANTTLAVQNALADGTNKVTVNLFTNLTDGVTYDVTVKDYVDFAGYKNVIRTFNVAYATDNTLPTVSLVSANQQYVVVKFDKPVTGLTLDNFYHTFTAWKPMGIYKTKADMDAGINAIVANTTNVTTVYVQFATTGVVSQFPLQPGTVNVHVLGNVGSVEVKDNWNNKLATTVLAATVTADLVNPTVTKVEAPTKTSLKITFDKAISNLSTTTNYEILNTNGTAVSNLSITSIVPAADMKSVTLNLSKDMEGETVIVNIKNVEDTTLNKNKLVGTHSATITFEDKEFAGIARVEFDNSVTPKVLYVVYNEAVNNTAINMANYKLLDGATVRNLTGPASFFGGNRVVKIELTTAQADWITVNTDKLLVANVEDLAGNKPAAFQLEQTIVAIGTQKANVTVTNGNANILAIDKNTVSLQFNQELTFVDPNEFALSINGAAYARPVALEITNNATGSLVKLTFTADIPANAPSLRLVSTTAAQSPVVAAQAFVNTKNIFNVTPNTINAGLAVNVQDRIKPSVQTITYVSPTRIEIKFTENLNHLTLALAGANGFTVAGGTLTSALLDGGDHSLVILVGSGFTSNTDVAYNGTQGIKDTNANNLDAFNRTTALTTSGVVLGATVETTAGVTAVNQVNTISLIGTATAAGNVVVDGVNVAVLENDTAAVVAGKIVAATIPNWNITAVGADLTFTAVVAAANVVDIVIAPVAGITLGTQATTVNGAAAVAEVGTVTVTAGATNTANITINVADGTLNKDVIVGVAAGDTAAQVATKIQAALAADVDVAHATTGYTVTVAGANVILTQNAPTSNVNLQVTLK